MSNPMITPASTPASTPTSQPEMEGAAAASNPQEQLRSPSSAAQAAELKSFIIQIFLPQPSRHGEQWVDIQPRSEIPPSDIAETAETAAAEEGEEGNLRGNRVEELELFVRVRWTLVPVFYRTLSGEIDDMVGGEGNGERAEVGDRIPSVSARARARARVRGWSREFLEECKEYKARYAMRGQHDPSREFNVER